jgi:hypothetical protein
MFKRAILISGSRNTNYRKTSLKVQAYVSIQLKKSLFIRDSLLHTPWKFHSKSTYTE